MNDPTSPIGGAGAKAPRPTGYFYLSRHERHKYVADHEMDKDRT